MTKAISKKVEFYNGIKKLGEVTTAPFLHTWAKGLPAGDYNFIAKATDDDGLIKSDSIKFTVKAAPNEIKQTETEQLSVFPNPTDNFFKLIIPDDARRIRVFDLDGKLYSQ